MNLTPKSYINNKIYEVDLIIKSSRNKTSDKDFKIPELSDYDIYLNNVFNMRQLRSCLTHYKQKTSGNKKELIIRIYNHSKYTYYIMKIQGVCRGYIRRLFNYYKGPNTKCINDSDFFTLSSFTERYNSNFFSYKDSKDFTYGFNAASFNMLINNKNNNNPYNRQTIETGVIDNFKRYIMLGGILKEDIEINLKNENKTLTLSEQINLKVQKIFQLIDELGHITHTGWFMDLSIHQLKNLYKELLDIWEYRVSLAYDTKRAICPPHGNPFINSNRNVIINNNEISTIRSILIDIIENMILKSVDSEARSLGAYYILGALTMIHPDAASSMPWLYESFNINTIIF